MPDDVVDRGRVTRAADLDRDDHRAVGRPAFEIGPHDALGAPPDLATAQPVPKTDGWSPRRGCSAAQSRAPSDHPSTRRSRAGRRVPTGRHSRSRRSGKWRASPREWGSPSRSPVTESRKVSQPNCESRVLTATRDEEVCPVATGTGRSAPGLAPAPRYSTSSSAVASHGVRGTRVAPDRAALGLRVQSSGAGSAQRRREDGRPVCPARLPAPGRAGRRCGTGAGPEPAWSAETAAGSRRLRPLATARWSIAT